MPRKSHRKRRRNHGTKGGKEQHTGNNHHHLSIHIFPYKSPIQPCMFTSIRILSDRLYDTCLIEPTFSIYWFVIKSVCRFISLDLSMSTHVCKNICLPFCQAIYIFWSVFDNFVGPHRSACFRFPVLPSFLELDFGSPLSSGFYYL